MRKLLHDAHRAKTAVDVVAQKHRHGLVKGGRLEIGLDLLSHLPQQVITTVDVADTIDPHAIRDPTLNRSRSRYFFPSRFSNGSIHGTITLIRPGHGVREA